METNEIVTQGIDLEHGPYRCPWQSLHLQAVGRLAVVVPDDMRVDMLVNSLGLRSIPLLKIYNARFTGLKHTRMLMYRRRKELDPLAAMDATKQGYNGWQYELNDTFKTHAGKLNRPFKHKFVYAWKKVPNFDIYAVSVAMLISAR